MSGMCLLWVSNEEMSLEARSLQMGVRSLT